MDYSTLDDKELFDRLEKAGLVEKLQTDPAWGLLKEAAGRIVDRAERTLVNTPASNTEGIIELQQVIKKWKYGLFAELEMLKQESEVAYRELQERDTLTR